MLREIGAADRARNATIAAGINFLLVYWIHVTQGIDAA